MESQHPTSNVRFGHFLTWPLAFPARLDHRLRRSEALFDFGAKLLSLVPGRMGAYLRACYYGRTLARCDNDIVMGFASFFSHPTAEVGSGVEIGAFSIIGTATIEDRVGIGNRVSILSGKHQHDVGHRDFGHEKGVHYERVRIGAGSYLGEGCIVMCDIGHDCIVCPGSVVTKPLPPGVTVAGNPALVVDPQCDALRSRASGR